MEKQNKFQTTYTHVWIINFFVRLSFVLSSILSAKGITNFIFNLSLLAKILVWNGKTFNVCPYLDSIFYEPCFEVDSVLLHSPTINRCEFLNWVMRNRQMKGEKKSEAVAKWTSAFFLLRFTIVTFSLSTWIASARWSVHSKKKYEYIVSLTLSHHSRSGDRNYMQ